MASKIDSKGANLVTSSIMLVNNPVSENMASYYPESSSGTHASTSTTSHCEDYPYIYQENMGPFSYGTYNPYMYSSVDHVVTAPRNCRCETTPAQDTFLHQILMGKGYKNDRLYVTPKPVIKQEVDYGSYGCCYGYPMRYNYPMYHY